MRNAYEIFDYYREAVVLTEDDCADFLVLVQDLSAETEGAMAVSGLSLALLERDWSKERVLLLMKAFQLQTADIVRERIIVGIILLLVKHNAIVRLQTDMHDMIQDVLTDEPELSFTALCNIARTSQVKYLEQFNQKMTKDIMPLMNKVGSDEFYEVISKHQSEMERIARLNLDQNFLIFKSSYYTDFFRSRAANWFYPWTDEQLVNVPEDEREQLREMMRIWPLCDSDRYALLGMTNMLRDTLREQFQGDMLAQMADTTGHATIITNGYVQQLYRYFRLSSFTHGTPFDLVAYLRETWVYRLIVVGDKAKRAINELLA
jgi:hypothetical protein